MADSKKLTHAGAVGAIREGGSVLVAGRIITRIEDLPNAAEWAAGDPAAEAAARSDLQAQIAVLQAQMARLQGGDGVKETATPTKPSTPAAPTHYEFLADEGDWKKGAVVAAEDLGDSAPKLLKAKTIKAVPAPDEA